MYIKQQWITDELAPSVIDLDAENPRLELESDAEQVDIRLRLLESEDIVELAKDIVNFGGLIPSETCVVIRNGKRFVVLEGNRRICACQLLLNPNLIPKEYRRAFPTDITDSLRNSISKISVSISPDRESAEPLLTRLHVGASKKAWRPLAKMRRAARLLDKNYTIGDIADQLGDSEARVRRLIRGYKIYQFGLGLGWTDEESGKLASEALDVTAFIRFFELDETRKILGDVFARDGSLTGNIPLNILKPLVKRMVRDFLLSQFEEDGPSHDTRTSPSVYLKDDLQKILRARSRSEPGHGEGGNKGNGDADGKKPDGNGKGTEATQKPQNAKPDRQPKPAEFFEDLRCDIESDAKLRLIVGEIAQINWHRFPIAASMLLRALLEHALKYQLRRAHKMKELIAECGKDPALDAVISFCALPKNSVFKDPAATTMTERLQSSGIKRQLDLVVHNRLQEMTPEILRYIAPQTRQLIQHILSDEKT